MRSGLTSTLKISVYPYCTAISTRCDTVVTGFSPSSNHFFNALMSPLATVVVMSSLKSSSLKSPASCVAN